MTLIEASRWPPADTPRLFDRLDRRRAIDVVGRHVFCETLFAEAFGKRDPLGGRHACEAFALLRLELLRQFAVHAIPV